MAKAKQEAEIIPPDKDDDATARAAAGARAGVHLRMPPFIDNEGGWRALLARLVGAPLSAFLSLMYRGGKKLIGGLLYRLTLVALVGTALAVTGYGIYQARHMALPQFDSFWHKEETAAQAMSGVTAEAPAEAELPLAPDAGEQNLPAAPDGFIASGDLADLQRQLQALAVPEAAQANDPANNQANNQTNATAIIGTADTAQSQAALSALQAQYADLQEKYAKLLATRGATQIEAQEDLQARVALGDLLLRLDSGAAYDDLLEGGALARVLRRSEWSLLALYADSGVPTRPALLTRFELWVANSMALQQGTPHAAENRLYGAVLDWLRARGDGLVRVRAAPLATADGDIALIAAALERGRHDEASWRMGALLRRLESDRSIHHPDTASLQLLYDDTRAAAELSPMLAALRDDYMAGARP
ncbi:MAG: hypothetical protein ACPHRG_05580 [Parvibaculales bacterium]